MKNVSSFLGILSKSYGRVICMTVHFDTLARMSLHFDKLSASLNVRAVQITPHQKFEKIHVKFDTPPDTE
jgi:hypothetical protein